MSKYCVLVADRISARLFTLESTRQPELESGPNLIEQRSLSNPDTTAKAQTLWSDSKMGRNRTRGGGGHGYDDHRGRHAQEFEKRFAKDVASEAVRLARQAHAKQMVVVAQDRTLGKLRSSIQPMLNGMALKELPKDLSKLSPRQLHNALAREQLLPELRRPVY